MTLRFSKYAGNISWDRYSFASYCGALEDGAYEMDVRKAKVKRSISQNRLYWMWLTCVQDESGTDKNDIHDLFRRKFLSKTVKFNGKRKRVAMSTAGLSKDQFTEYLNKIQVFVNTELAIVLPNPSDVHFSEFEEKYRDRI
jgi:hypothetical protein